MVTDRWIDFSPGVRARVRSGAGDIVLWVHGFTIDSSLWSDLWGLLPEYSHIGVDLPGHGESAPLPEGQRLAELGEILATAAITLGVRHVVGLSLGSVIATQIALSRPEAFATLCLGAPALAGGPVEPSVGFRYIELEQLFAALGPGPWMRALWMQAPPDLFTYAVRSPALRDRLIDLIDRHRWEELCGPGVARMGSEHQPIDALGQIGCRTLVLIGEHEFPAFRRTAAILRTSIPRCAVRELGDTGHLCMLESVEESAAAIAAHLRGDGG
jgi:pimeloyl-ACP methyl ester carboxylesterase